MGTELFSGDRSAAPAALKDRSIYRARLLFNIARCSGSGNLILCKCEKIYKEIKPFEVPRQDRIRLGTKDLSDLVNLRMWSVVSGHI
jgi:hypothetical protein